MRTKESLSSHCFVSILSQPLSNLSIPHALRTEFRNFVIEKLLVFGVLSAVKSGSSDCNFEAKICFNIACSTPFGDYSTVSFVRCDGGFSIADLTFNFAITYRSPALTGNHYSEYQLFLYQTISEHREKGMTFDAIAQWLNKEGYLTVRGKRFRGAHVHSILKKRLVKEKLLKREYPEVWSEYNLEVVDKTILMSDFGFSK